MSEERITYEEFIIMFRNAPRIAYTLYDKAEDEISKLNNIIEELEKELLKKLEAVKNLKDILGEDVYTINPHIDLLNQEYNYFLDKLKELKGGNNEKM